ncbi:MAG TPA: hypothetical protein VJO52_04910 [Gemmatimonadaceae bacterium]|nr:hypothetical protein [Gemmatimonadaceae bacterium]
MTLNIPIALTPLALARLEGVIGSASTVPSLFRESGGLIALPLIAGLFLVGQVWRRNAQAPAWPQLLVLALVLPPVLLCGLGEVWADRDAAYFTWRGIVLLGLAVTELLLSVVCVRAARRWDAMPSIVSVALVWTLMSWIYAALAVGGDSM